MKNFRKALLLFFTALFTISLLSCASTGGSGPKDRPPKKKKFKQDAFDKAFENGNINSCIDMMYGKNPDLKDTRDNLDLAMLFFINGDSERSSHVFELSDFQINEAFTKSVTREIGAALGNENSTSYAGNYYEYLLVNSMNALNFVRMNDYENAAVEIEKYGNKLKDYGAVDNSYDDDLHSESTKAALTTLNLRTEDLTASIPEKPSEKDRYTDSAFARYVALIIDKRTGNEAQIEQDAKQLHGLGSSIDVSEDLKIPVGKGRLDVIALGGLIGLRQEVKLEIQSPVPFFLPIKGSLPIPFKLKFVWPGYNGNNPKAVDEVLVELADGTVQHAVLIENLDAAVSKDVKLRARRAYNRSISRSLTKKAATLAAGTVTLIALNRTEQETGSIFASLAYAAGYHSVVAGVDAIDKTETADIRQGKFFPSSVSAAGFTLDPGTYSGKTTFFRNGQTIGYEEFIDVIVKSGLPTLVVTSCLK